MMNKIGPAGIPAIGLGTWMLEGETATRMVNAALSEGYRHIDTAQAYGNEDHVGHGIRQSDVPRDQIFLTTKILPGKHSPDVLKRECEASLGRLGTDYVDLLLLHWPDKDVPIADTVGAMNELISEGKIRHAGVSNFTIDQVETARQTLSHTLAANQIEFHPYIDQTTLLSWMIQNEIPFEAYSPLGRGEVLGDPILKEIADAKGASPAQVVLAWIVSKPLGVAIPKTSSPERLSENLAAAEITLTEEEARRIDGLARKDGRIVSPEGMAPDWDD